MKTAGAGGIILIGVGILLLNLAYTGRGAAVWSALRGSGASGSNSPGAGPDTPANTTRKEVSRTYVGGNIVRIFYDDGTTEDVPAHTVGGGDGSLFPDARLVRIS